MVDEPTRRSSLADSSPVGVVLSCTLCVQNDDAQEIGWQSDHRDSSSVRRYLLGMNRIEWDEEAAAASLLAEILGGTVQRRDGHDEQQRDSTHDLDVLLTDGTVIAVEVTQATSPAAQKQLTETTKRNWDFPHLHSQWYLSIRQPGTNIKRLHQTVPAILEALDDAGIEHYERADPRLTDTFHAQIAGLGIRGIARLGPASIPNVLISGTARGGAYGPNSVADIVQDHASRADNAHKLSLADANSRHLFIWINADIGDAVAAMYDPWMPTAMPALPSSIHEIWIATAYSPPTVWHYDQAEWRIVDLRRSN
jgi:hypothetical protein